MSPSMRLRKGRSGDRGGRTFNRTAHPMQEGASRAKGSGRRHGRKRKAGDSRTLRAKEEKLERDGNKMIGRENFKIDITDS